MDNTKQLDEQIAERRKAMMAEDFAPLPPESTHESRVAYALEYIAYQFGQINRKTDTLISLLENQRPKIDD